MSLKKLRSKFFTKKIDLWWPKTHHVGKYPMTESVLENFPGGRWYSRHEDGSEITIGKILTWEPFSRLILAWQIDGNFQYDPELVTEVVVHFFAEGTKKTRVTLVHHDLQKLMGGAKLIGEMDYGWNMILNLYKNLADEAN